jgi:hypothetical protein
MSSRSDTGSAVSPVSRYHGADWLFFRENSRFATGALPALATSDCNTVVDPAAVESNQPKGAIEAKLERKRMAGGVKNAFHGFRDSGTRSAVSLSADATSCPSCCRLRYSGMRSHMMPFLRRVATDPSSAQPDSRFSRIKQSTNGNMNPRSGKSERKVIFQPCSG